MNWAATGATAKSTELRLPPAPHLVERGSCLARSPCAQHKAAACERCLAVAPLLDRERPVQPLRLARLRGTAPMPVRVTRELNRRVPGPLATRRCRRLPSRAGWLRSCSRACGSRSSAGCDGEAVDLAKGTLTVGESEDRGGRGTHDRSHAAAPRGADASPGRAPGGGRDDLVFPTRKAPPA